MRCSRRHYRSNDRHDSLSRCTAAALPDQLESEFVTLWRKYLSQFCRHQHSEVRNQPAVHSPGHRSEPPQRLRLQLVAWRPAPTQQQPGARFELRRQPREQASRVELHQHPAARRRLLPGAFGGAVIDDLGRRGNLPVKHYSGNQSQFQRDSGAASVVPSCIRIFPISIRYRTYTSPTTTACKPH